MQKDLPGYNIELAKKRIRELQERYERKLKRIVKIFFIDLNQKRGSFGSGIILEVIKNIPVPVYVITANVNLDKIKKVMDDFEHETKDLWKIDGKTYKTLTEIEEDIEKTDKEIDEMVYELYGITENEKKVIEESLK